MMTLMDSPSKNQITIEQEQARLARWFSKDSCHMPVYYDRKGYARPVTRDEQDLWIAAGYAIVSDYAKSGMATSYSATVFLVSFTIFILPYFERISPTASIVSIIVAMVLFASILGQKLVRYRLHLYQLRNSIEAHLRFRNPIAAPEKRRNAFAVLGRGAGFLMFAAYGVIMINNTKLREMFGQQSENIYVYIFYGLFAIAALGLAIMSKVDKAHIRQTGKWFRWRR
jgi:hypothetical protein